MRNAPTHGDKKPMPASELDLYGVHKHQASAPPSICLAIVIDEMAPLLFFTFPGRTSVRASTDADESRFTSCPWPRLTRTQRRWDPQKGVGRVATE